MAKAHPLKRLLQHADHHRGRVALASAYAIINKIFDLAPPVLIGAAVDIVVEREASFFSRLGVVDVMDQLVVLAVLTVVVWALESVFEYLYATMWRNLAQAVQHELRVDAYRHIQKLEMAYFHQQSTGGLMSILNDDVNQLERFLDEGAKDLLHVGTTVVVICTAFFWMAPSVAWMAMLPIPFVLWGSFRFQRMLGPRYADVREQVGILNGQLSNNLTGIATIKSYATEDYEAGRITAESQKYATANKAAIKLSSAFSPLIRMVIVVGFTATLVWGGHLALEGTIAVGTYSVMVFLTQRLLWPLTRLGRTFDLYQRAVASTARIMDLLETEVTICDGHTRMPVDQIKGEVEFRDVTFAYPGREPALRGFNLKLSAGTTLGVVGATGAGKSTLINLLLRFYEPQSGQILLDGVDIATLELGDLRRAIGLVSQSVFLFHGSVGENIVYGTFDAAQAEVEDAAAAAEAVDFIDRLPQVYDTVVGERGQMLSGGQRQRLSIARAVLKDPPILVLDEATSAVDNETEAAIQRSMEHIARDRTTIVIAHRLSTIRNADTIIVLEEGELVELGDHDALIAQDGLYARLWRVQTGALVTGA